MVVAPNAVSDIVTWHWLEPEPGLPSLPRLAARQRMKRAEAEWALGERLAIRTVAVAVMVTAEVDGLWSVC